MLGILEVGMHFDPARGGVDRFFEGLLGGFETERIPFTAVAFGEAPHPISPDAQRISLGNVDNSLVTRLASLHRFGKHPSRQLDLISSHFALYALPLCFGNRKIPHVVHFHGPWADESSRESENSLAVHSKRAIEKYVYRSADHLIVLSSAFRDILTDRYQIPKERISVIPAGVDTNHFHNERTKIEARRKMNWPLEGPLVFCVRRLVRRMGIELLIQAFASILSEYPTATLCIGGRGPLQTELQNEIHEAGIGGRVRLIGFIPDDLLPVAYAAADFSIVPSQSLEGFGLITLESLACGTPVLVTPVGGLPETVINLDPSLILPGTDLEAIVTGLKRGLKQPLPAREQCLDYARTHFSWATISRRIANTYERVADDFVR